MDARTRLEDLHRRAESGGGEDRLRRQRDGGRLTARERIDTLFDPGTFEEIDKFVTHRCRDFGMADQVVPGDGVVAGHGRVNGRLVFAFAQDFTVFGGSLSETNGAKIAKIMDLALKMGAPFVGLNDSGGARIQEGVLSLGAYADIFLRNTLASGVIPQISAIMGPCAGGAVYSPAITDFTIMVKDTSYMFVTGPEVIKAVTHEQVTKDELGGALTHNERSGVAHFAVDDDARVPALIRELLTLLPSNNVDDAPRAPASDPPDRADEMLDTVVPAVASQAYDMLDVVHAVADDGYFLEVQRLFARNILVGFARLGGRTGGRRGQPAGPPRGRAGHRRIREGGALRPILRRVQHPAGHLRGRARVPAWHGAGVRRHHPARREAALRLCGGHGAQGHRDHAQGLRRRLLRDVQQAPANRRELCMAHGRDRRDGRRGRGEHPLQARAGCRRRRGGRARREDHASTAQKFANPYVAAERGFVDEVIQPRHTRAKLITALAALETKRDKNPAKKHGNIPL